MINLPEPQDKAVQNLITGLTILNAVIWFIVILEISYG